MNQFNEMEKKLVEYRKFILHSIVTLNNETQSLHQDRLLIKFGNVMGHYAAGIEFSPLLDDIDIKEFEGDVDLVIDHLKKTDNYRHRNGSPVTADYLSVRNCLHNAIRFIESIEEYNNL